MKIIHIVEGFGGGVYSFLVDLCNSLSKDNEVILVYNRREQTPEKFMEDFNPKVKFINLPMRREINIIEDLKGLIGIIKIIKNEKPDIVHLHSSKAGVLGRIATKIMGYKREKVFYNPHGFAFLQQNISVKKRKIYFVIEKIMANIQGINIAVSKGEYEESIRLSKNTIRIDNSIDNYFLDKLIKPVTYKNNPTIGTIGRLTYQKNPKCFNELANKFPDIKFIWIGDGDLRKELKSPNIEITGWKNRYSVIELMNSIDIYIQTSLWEGLPIALLEAMYMGKPVIVSNVIGNKDVVNSYTNGFIADNIEDYEKYIKELICDRKLFYRISEEAKRYIIENHLLNDMLNKYKKLYSNEIKDDEQLNNTEYLEDVFL